MVGPHCAHLWLQFLCHTVQPLCPWLQILALCWGLVLRLAEQREADGKAAGLYRKKEGEGVFMFPAWMFTWLRVGWGLWQQQPCCGTAELIRACGILVINVTCQELLALQKWLGWCLEDGRIPCLLGGSPVCSVTVHGVWRAEVVPLQTLKTTSILAVSRAAAGKSCASKVQMAAKKRKRLFWSPWLPGFGWKEIFLNCCKGKAANFLGQKAKRFRAQDRFDRFQSGFLSWGGRALLLWKELLQFLGY